MSKADIWVFIVLLQRMAMLSRLAKIPTKATVANPTPSVAKLYFRKILYHFSVQVMFVAK